VGGCFDPDVVGGIGLPPGAVGKAPDVPPGLTAGEAPGLPVGLTPIRLGGTNLFPAGGAFGGTPGVALTVGTFAPGLAAGLTRLGGIGFWPITGAGEPLGPGDPGTCPFLRICGVGSGAGFGRCFGGGFC
jgi:hypothetical protein